MPGPSNVMLRLANVLAARVLYVTEGTRRAIQVAAGAPARTYADAAGAETSLACLDAGGAVIGISTRYCTGAVGSQNAA